MTNIQYMIFDIECLKGYFSIQWRNENQEEAKIFECYNDSDCHKLYKSLQSQYRSMYCYSIDFDKTMLNSLCKLVEANETNIVNKLRLITDYLIRGNISYFRLNKEFWCDLYFKDTKDTIDDKFAWSIEKLSEKYDNENSKVRMFLAEFPYILGKSKVFKKLNIIEIPKMLYYFNIRKDGVVRPSISLKNLQLASEQVNLKIDFDTYNAINKIKEAGLYKTWIEYSLNDVDYLYRLFQEKCLSIIETRIYACQAIQQFHKDFEYDDSMIHSETNTNLLVKAFSLPEEQKNQKITMNYLDYIKPTGYDTFDNFVSFVSKNTNDVNNDKELKNLYCDEFQKKYIDDDSRQMYEGQIDTIVKTIDKFDLFGTLATVGFGGIHSALINYESKDNETLWHLDYTSLYPSIILQFKELYNNLINVKLYESLYNFRNKEIKPKLNDPSISESDKRNLENISNGAKLLLNSLYGILNSTFNLPISNKVLGRFICLYGQYRAIELSKLIVNKAPESQLSNINTDGVIATNLTKDIVDEIVTIDKDNYLTLGVKTIDKLIQYDVNNYIKISGDSMKTKGNTFKTGIKKKFNRNEKIDVNMENALQYINRTNRVECLPILFHGTKLKPSILLDGSIDTRDKVYYLTSKDKGYYAVKNIMKPLVLNIDNEIMYFTDNQEDADLSEYIKFARLTENKIHDFTINKIDNTMKYNKYQLSQDTDENIKLKRKTRKELSTVFDKDMICLASKDNKIMCEGIKLSQGYNNYSMTDVLKSKEAEIVSIKLNSQLLLITTTDKNSIETLDSLNTFTVRYKDNMCFYVFNTDTFHQVISGKSNIKYKVLNRDYLPCFSTDTMFTYEINDIK